jgi:excisionase family DNA binding protein
MPTAKAKQSTPADSAALSPVMAVRPREAARLLSVSERVVWSWIAKGKLKVTRVGGGTLISAVSLRRLVGS